MEFGDVKNNSCKEVSFDTTNNFTGKDHLHIKWDASKCNYIALGLKWSNFKGKNLKPIIKSAAIELHVRIDSEPFQIYLCFLFL